MIVKRSKFLKFMEVLFLLFFDIFIFMIVYLVAYGCRKFVMPLFFPFFPQVTFQNVFNDSWWILCILLSIFFYEGMYTRRYPFWDEIKQTIKSIFICTLFIFAIISLGKLSEGVSRTFVLLFAFFSVLLFPPFRLVLRKLLRKLGLTVRKVLIIGTGNIGEKTIEAIEREPNYGYRIVAYLDPFRKHIIKNSRDFKVFTRDDKALRYIQASGISDVIIALPSSEKSKAEELIRTLQHRVENIVFIPDISGLAIMNATYSYFLMDQICAIEIKNNLSKSFNSAIKRLFDILLSLILLFLLAFPMLFIAVLVKLSSRGGVFFGQKRIGKKGTVFKCYKFRTMYVDAEERLKKILSNDVEAKKEYEAYWKLKNDPRITKIGKLLRKASLDELPQLFNVLKGDMSLVGPRPYIPSETELWGDYGEIISSIRPGITGLWQVSGRSNKGYEYRIAMDAWYVTNWNLWLDIVLLIRTVKAVVDREGAR